MSTLLRQRMLQDLELTGLVPSTQEVYLRCVRKLTAHCFESAGNGMTAGFELAYNSNGRSSMRKPRKHYAAVEKVAILRRHLIERIPVSDLCDQYHIQPSMFYNWQKQFFENGAAAFEQTRSAPEKHQERKIAALQDKLQRKNEVVAELLEEHVKLKKVLGEL